MPVDGDACGRRCLWTAAAAIPRRCDAASVSETAHPLLPASLPLLLSGPDGLQVGGVDSHDGLLVTADGGWVRALLRGLDGRRTQRTVLADADRDGLDPGAVRSLLGGLRAAGLLLDVDPADLLATHAGPAAEARTAVELPAALAGGVGWRARRAATVVVEGATRVGTPLAALLAASGVGRVSVRDPGLVTAGDAVVGGLTADDEGRPRSLAAADAIRRGSPLTDLPPPPAGRPPPPPLPARAGGGGPPPPPGGAPP